MYVMVCTRPDFLHAVGTVSRYMHNPGKEHWASSEMDSKVHSENLRCWFDI